MPRLMRSRRALSDKVPRQPRRLESRQRLAKIPFQVDMPHASISPKPDEPPQQTRCDLHMIFERNPAFSYLQAL